MRRLSMILPIVLIALVFVICVGVLLYVMRGGQQAAPPGDDEGQIARSAASPVVTGSPITNIGSGGELDGGWYRLAFTAPQYPDNPANHQGGLDTKLVALIDTAKTSVDVADYDFDLLDVADALARARGRGATVRMVTDTDTLTNKDAAVQAAFKRLRDAGIPIVDDKRQPIMHNKFTVVDKEWVETGSWNYTDGDTYHLNNNMIVIQSKDLATNYSTEFAKMFEKNQFGPTKDKAIPNPTLTINGTPVETCFASENRCADRILARLKESQQSIRFLAFSYTSDPIEEEMVARGKAGVQVSGVFETTGSQTQYSAYGKLKKAGFPVYTEWQSLDHAPQGHHHR